MSLKLLMIMNKLHNKISLYSVLCILSAIAVLFPSCDSEYFAGHVTTAGAGSQLNLTADITSVLTPSASFAAGDSIAVTTSYYDQSSLNRFYTTSDGLNFKAADDVNMYVKGNGVLSAYYPAIGTDGVEPVIELATLDQAAKTDYLFARTQISREEGNVRLSFRHALGRLNATIKAASEEHIRRVVVSGFYHTATVDPYSWAITLTDAPQSYILDGTDITSFSLDLIPQTVAAEAVIPAELTLIGEIRSYTVALGTLPVASDEIVTATVDITSDVATVSFSGYGMTWTNYEDKFTNGISFTTDSIAWRQHQ